MSKNTIEKADIEYPFEHGAVINYTLNGVSIQKWQRYRRPSQLSCQRVRIPLRYFTMRPIVTLKQLQSLMSEIGKKLRMDQQHCSYSTILTNLNDREKKNEP
jgi:hypothetical protein